MPTTQHLPADPALGAACRHAVEARPRRFSDVLLSTDPKMRFRLTIWAISFITFKLYYVILLVEMALGFVAPVIAVSMMIAVLVANIVFYALIRSDLSRRVSKDPGLGLEQLCLGLGFMWLNYAVSGPAAGASLIVMASQMVYAIFAVPGGAVWRFAAMMLMGLAMTMLLCHALDPARYPAGEQLVRFLYAALVIPLIARLAQDVSRMQDLIRQRGNELQVMLTKVQELAMRDELTQTYNRRHLSETLDLLSVQHSRRNSPMCVALLDLDHFKSVNDRFGHDAGDQVLKRFAKAIQDTLRTSDVLGRWGGEEFVICLSDTSVEQAPHVLTRIHQIVRAVPCDDIGPGMRLTFSAGIAQLRAEEAVGDTIKRADEAMYRAKHAGRDRFELA